MRNEATNILRYALRLISLPALLTLTSCTAQKMQSQTAPSIPATPIATYESYDFLFELFECRIPSTRMTCTFMITNNGDDRNVYISSRSQKGTNLVDDHGNNYRADAQAWRIGNVGQESVGFGTGGARLVPRGRVRGTVWFDQLRPRPNNVTLLEIEFTIRGQRPDVIWIPFENFPVSP